jgi:copper(I)-binding protein
MRNRSLGLVASIGLVAVVAACGDDSASGVSIDDPWARTSARMQDAGAVYFTLTGGDSGDSLIGVSVSSDVAAMAEIHETIMSDMGDSGDMGDMGESSDMGGAMTMQAVDAVAFGAGEAVVFAPGGYHVMLMDLVDPLETGDMFDLTFMFQNEGQVTVMVEVREG